MPLAAISSIRCAPSGPSIARCACAAERNANGTCCTSAAGTSVPRMPPIRVKNWMSPATSALSAAGSLPGCCCSARRPCRRRGRRFPCRWLPTSGRAACAASLQPSGCDACRKANSTSRDLRPQRTRSLPSANRARRRKVRQRKWRRHALLRAACPVDAILSMALASAPRFRDYDADFASPLVLLTASSRSRYTAVSASNRLGTSARRESGTWRVHDVVRRMGFGGALLIAVLALPALAVAQTEAVITGVVTDSSGGVLPGRHGRRPCTWRPGTPSRASPTSAACSACRRASARIRC